MTDEWKDWNSLPFPERDRLPSAAGIYLVADAKDIVWYIGKAANLKARWVGRTHHRYPELNRSHSRRNYRVHWQLYSTKELDKVERTLIKVHQPILNDSKVKAYSLGKPQLKCEAFPPHPEGDYVFFRGSYAPYEGIGDELGIYRCIPGDEANIAITKQQVVKRKHAFVLGIYYVVDGKSKQQLVLCSVSRAIHHISKKLEGIPYKEGL
ncbi:MAG: hypothetical protein HC924_06785 [Synechococcaceae cyanobacterium SM2_3_2]|nr:hypothetical protein [Synechococcaceae cyanobacterium SM2_3_2]